MRLSADMKVENAFWRRQVVCITLDKGNIAYLIGNKRVFIEILLECLAVDAYVFKPRSELVVYGVELFDYGAAVILSVD